MKKIAIITVTYNAEKNLSFFLPSIEKNDDVVESVYFVDNNSEDNTISTVQSWKEKTSSPVNVEIIKNRQNEGYTKGINIGIQKALDDGYDYILVTNNDIIFHEGSIAIIKSDMDSNSLDVVGVPASINEGELGLGYNLDINTYLPKKDTPTRRENLQYEINKNPVHYIGFVHGGTILFNRYFFERIGLYDHHLFFGGDELDFLYRVTAYNAVNTPKIKCAVSLRAFTLIDNLTKHNTGNKIIKARGMLQGNARVNLKHRFTPTQIGLYKEQHNLIQNLSKRIFIRYVALYLFALRGLFIEIFRYYTSSI